MNLHLYIPQSSEHPLSYIKSKIYSLVLQYFKQKTYQKDFTYYVGLLYYRLLQQGWEREVVRKLILEVTTRAENKPASKPPTTDPNKLRNTIFLHSSQKQPQTLFTIFR